MDEDTKSAIKLEVHEVLAQEVGAYRSHLEEQFNFLLKGIGIIVLVAGGLFVFFAGHSWSDLDSTIQGKVDSAWVAADGDKLVAHSAVEAARSRTVKGHDSIGNQHTRHAARS
jgi:hypothetical protein